MPGKKLLFVSANRYVNPYPVYPLGISYLFTYLSERLPDFDIRIKFIDQTVSVVFFRVLQFFPGKYQYMMTTFDIASLDVTTNIPDISSEHDHYLQGISKTGSS